MGFNPRNQIFQTINVVESLLAHVPIFPKYSTTGKLAGLTAAFGAQGNKRLCDLYNIPTWPAGPSGQPVKILIVGFDYDSLRATFFRSYPTAQGATASLDTVVNAVHASSNAPVSYFDAPAAFSNHRYWDGAMGGFNNPLMAAVTDALAEKVSAAGIAALSIGTGTVKLLPASAAGQSDAYVRQPLETSSIINDLGTAAGCITDDPPDNASYSAHVILSAARGIDPANLGPVVRLNAVIRPVFANQMWTKPPGLSIPDFNALKSLGMDAVQDDQVALIQTLGAAWIAGTVPNQPIRMTSDTLENAPGEADFISGKDRWLTM